MSDNHISRRKVLQLLAGTSAIPIIGCTVNTSISTKAKVPEHELLADDAAHIHSALGESQPIPNYEVFDINGNNRNFGEGTACPVKEDAHERCKTGLYHYLDSQTERRPVVLSAMQLGCDGCIKDLQWMNGISNKYRETIHVVGVIGKPSTVKVPELQKELVEAIRKEHGVSFSTQFPLLLMRQNNLNDLLDYGLDNRAEGKHYGYPQHLLIQPFAHSDATLDYRRVYAQNSILDRSASRIARKKFRTEGIERALNGRS
ncbi:MAG: hypothetical protein ACE5DM_01975 [Candidatus Nanoarchaeia archaeon]